MTEQRERGVAGGRRRFMAHALGVGGGALLTSVVGCEEAADVPTPAPIAPPEPAPTPAAPVAAPSALSGKDMDALIVHGDTPPTWETRRELLGSSVITATPRLFVRQNLPLPPPSVVADRDAWRVSFTGVHDAGELSVAELKRLGLVTVATVLQCSGNGRSFFEHGPSGSPWSVGAAGCALWSGVPLRAVSEHLGGPLAGARFLTATGGEPLPPDVQPNDVVVERSIPLEKALLDSLLAWELNGEPIPLAHGGPLRLIVPGYYGVNQVKFVKQVAFTEQPTSAKIHATGYRMRPIGERGSTEQPTLWEMGPKSFITHPTARTPQPAGRVLVQGVAFGGTEAVQRVDYSHDGTTWQEAALVGPDLGPYAWRVFHFIHDASAGPLTLFSRVTTVSGRVQPEQRLENDSGYANESWRDMGVVVQVCAPDDAACLVPPDQLGRRERRTGPVNLSEAGQRGRAIFTERAQPSCTTCHALAEAQATGTVGPNLDDLGPSLAEVRAAVANGVGVMPSFTQHLSAQEMDDVAAYVFEATR